VTEPRLGALLELVPITRLYNATSLDYLGVPVWAAVTPRARDLTVHLGRGPTAARARIGAVMEAVERVSAEAVDPCRVLRASFASLRRSKQSRALDPEAFELPFQTAYRRDRLLSWVDGTDLLANEHVRVPADLTLSPACEGVCIGVETNGLAAGGTRTEATVSALLEVIERDAFSHDRFANAFLAAPLRLVELASLPAEAAELVRGLAAREISVEIRDISHDVGVPVFYSTIRDRSFPGNEGRTVSFGGLGADIDASEALLRSIYEAVQSHTALIVGARDSFEQHRGGPRLSVARLIERLLSPSSTSPFAYGGFDTRPDDARGRLELLLERLRSAGLHRCVAVDLTSARLRVPVVRVLVPGTAAPYGESTRRPPRRLLRALVKESFA
jgi:ribosomal protein S12 methylthiotransferase accessory factor